MSTPDLLPRLHVRELVGAVGAPFWAFFGDMSYSILFTVAIVLMVVVLLLGIFCFGKMKGLQADWT